MSRESLWNGIVMENPSRLFRLGTDSVVLADFVNVKPGSKICDLGCGSGAISLMLLAKDRSLFLTGVELQEDLCRVAEENARINTLVDHFAVFSGDLREIRDLLPAGSFGCVVANPPYFPAANPAPQENTLALSRSEKTCTPEDLCRAAAWLLPTGGSFFLVHRPERLADLIFALRQSGLEPKRLQFVRHSTATKRSLLLLEAVRGGKPHLQLEEDLVLYHPDGSQTEACRRIYHR